MNVVQTHISADITAAHSTMGSLYGARVRMTNPNTTSAGTGEGESTESAEKALLAALRNASFHERHRP